MTGCLNMLTLAVAPAPSCRWVAAKGRPQSVPSGCAPAPRPYQVRRPRKAATGVAAQLRPAPPASRAVRAKFYTAEDSPEIETLVHGYTVLWYDQTVADDPAQLPAIEHMQMCGRVSGDAVNAFWTPIPPPTPPSLTAPLASQPPVGRICWHYSGGAICPTLLPCWVQLQEAQHAHRHSCRPDRDTRRGPVHPRQGHHHR